MDGVAPNMVRLTHIGGPTVLIEIGRLRLLTDPTFEPAGYHYAAGPQTIAKTASPALAASALGSVDAVLLSHDQHGDNLDPAGRDFLAKARQVFTTPAGAERLGGKARGLAAWTTVLVQDERGMGVRITATPAQHGPATLSQATGDVTGWLLELDGQECDALYLSGDTVLFDGAQEVARRYRVGVALLHCGAAQAERFGPVPITLPAVEAARFAAMLGRATIVPIHYEGWTHLTEGRSEIERAFRDAGLEQRLRFLTPGSPETIQI